MLALAALDAGTAPGGLAAARTASLACLAEPALFLVILALGLLGGTTNLDLLIGQQHQGMLQPPAAAALAAACAGGPGLASSDPAGQTAEFSGGDLALVELAEALRMLVWFDLIGALFLPLGMAEPGAGPLGWVDRVARLGGEARWYWQRAWRRCAAPPDASALGRTPQVLGIAAVLGLLAALLVLASAVAA